MANDVTDSDQQAPTSEPNPPSAAKSGMKRILMVGAAVVVIAGGIWLFHYQTRGKYFEDTNDAFIQADAVTISPKISGYVDAVLVGDNQDVKAGQPLVRIDPRDYDAQARQYQAQIDVAKANAENVRATIGEQQAAIAQAQAQLVSAEEDARYAEREAARYAPLAASCLLYTSPSPRDRG